MLVITGDIGGLDGYHAGDEAMFSANLANLRKLQPRTQILAISRDPMWTSNHYDVQAIPTLGFSTQSGPEGDAAREELWIEPSASANGRRIRDAIAGASQLIISGGGNLRSWWPEHIYDRMALIRMAREARTQVIVLGQTIGPDLVERNRELLRTYLNQAQMVGVRESESAALCLSLGLRRDRLCEQLDDAWFLEGQPCAVAFDIERPWIAVSLAPFEDAASPGLEAVIAGQLSGFIRRSGADVVFIPHWTVDGWECDGTVASRVAKLIDTPQRAHLLRQLTAEQICWLTRRAALVIASRYHACVFGLSGSVPTLGIYSGEYGRMRHVGVQRHAGMEECALTLQACLRGGLADAAEGLWKRRNKVRRRLLSLQERWRAMEEAKWRQVFCALTGLERI